MIGVTEVVMHKAFVAKTGNRDPEFGKRLRAMITAHGSWKSLRDFAVNGMGWAEEGAGQRLDNYLRGRIPDLDTLIKMGRALGSSVPELLGHGQQGQAEEDGARGILVYLLELEGIPQGTADTIANAFLEAQRLYRTIPADEAPDALAKFSAHVAWLQRQPRAQGT